MIATQKHRTIAVASPLGADTLLFRRMEARERLSQPFEYHLDLLSEHPDLKFTDVLGQPMVVRLDLPKTEQIRYFHGLVSEFRQVRNHGRYAAYQATLRPWLWFLSNTTDCRIYQNRTVPAIVKAIFQEHGFDDFEIQLIEPRPPRDYCVQYRESTLDFVSRLLEEEGIYYYFKHEENRHVLVLADSLAAHAPFPGYSEVPYVPSGMHGRRFVEHIHDWEVTQRVQPGAYAHTDFDFKIPQKDLYRRLEVRRRHARDHYEIYDYPGDYTEADRGESYARIRLEELHAQGETVQGHADARGLAVGWLFNLVNGPREDQNRQYLLTETRITLDADDYEARAEGEPEGPLYDCRFTALDAKEPYRPRRVTPKGLVRGPQTATVVGPAGQEIWTDQHGRVKCQFHWDRYGESDENSSCWIRVSQPWAGKGWGGISIPRIGQEVIVDFLEGDPDRPIITGRVYNGASKPPYALPAGAVISGMKSNTTGKIGYQEDKPPPRAATVQEEAGSYRYSVQDGNYTTSQSYVLYDPPPLYDVGRSAHRVESPVPPSGAAVDHGGQQIDSPTPQINSSVPDDKKPEFMELAQNIFNDKLGKRRKISKEQFNEKLSSGYNEICMDDTMGQELMRMHAQYDQDAIVNHDETAQVGNDLTRSVGNDETVIIGNDETLIVGNNSSESIGVNKVITAGTSITLKCGASMIHMNQAGVITITGSLITVAATINTNVAAPITNVMGTHWMTTTGSINLVSGGVTRVVGATLGHFEGGKAELIGNTQTLVKGPKVNVEGGETTTVKGGQVNIDGGTTSIVGAPVKVN